MAVEVANLVFAERAAFGHDFEKLFERFGEVVEVVNAGLEQGAEKMFGQQACVFREEAKDDAIEKACDAEVFALREIHFRAGPGVGQFLGFTLLQGPGDIGNGLGQVFGNLRRGALRLEEVGVFKQIAEQPKVIRAVNLVVGKFVSLLDRPLKFVLTT